MATSPSPWTNRLVVTLHHDAVTTPNLDCRTRHHCRRRPVACEHYERLTDLLFRGKAKRGHLACVPDDGDREDHARAAGLVESEIDYGSSWF